MHSAVTNGSYDVGRIRQDFPILSMQVYGKPLVYLDNAASAQKPQSVLDRIQQAYHLRIRQRASRAALPRQRRDRGLRGRAREGAGISECAAARRGHLHPQRDRSDQRSSPTRSAASASSPATRSCCRSWSTTPTSCHGISCASAYGAVIKWAPVDEEGNFLIDEFEKLLTPRTKMVAITHMSNMTGTHVPVKEVVKRAHARNIPVLVDGSQAAVHLDVDVQDIGCDFYVFTGHKLYGPTGIGVLWGKYDLLAEMPPFNGGGEMIREVAEDRITYGEPPHRFEAGTPPIVAGDRARRRDRLRQLGRQAAHPRARDRPGDIRPRAAARDQLDPYLRHHQRQGADRVV